MGFIKKFAGSVSGALKDQYKDAIRCGDMPDNILMMKKTTRSGVITDGSRVIVAPGQLAAFYNSGRITDAIAEPGAYEFDSKESPSFFGGDEGADFSLSAPLKDIWERFTFGGQSPKEQAIFYFNMKEIVDNKFGTMAPMMYADWGHAVLNARVPGGQMGMSVSVKFFGTYSFRILDPALFMNQIAGTGAIVEKEDVTKQMQSEVLSAFQTILNRLGSEVYKVPLLELPSKTYEIRAIMEAEVLDAPIRNRGLKIESFAINSLQMDADSKEKIRQWEISGDTLTQQAMLNRSYGKALENAGGNAGSAINGIMGIGMMNMAGSQMANMVGTTLTPGTVSATPGAVPAAPFAAASSPAAAVCPNCGAAVKGKFCAECGTPVPQPKFCPNCGAPVSGKFCAECGAPADAGPKKCPNCGAEVKGKFCAECGAATS